MDNRKVAVVHPNPDTFHIRERVVDERRVPSCGGICEALREDAVGALELVEHELFGDGHVSSKVVGTVRQYFPETSKKSGSVLRCGQNVVYAKTY